MPEAISAAQYFKLTVPNQPGEGAKLVAGLQQAGVNLRALLAFPRGDGSQVDLVAADPDALQAAAQQAGWELDGPATCFLLEGDDRPGALVDTMQKLGDAGVNVTAVAATASGQGRFGAILWVDPESVGAARAALGVA